VAASATSVFISRIRNLPVLDDAGDQVGRLRDVVVQRRAGGHPPRVKGLAVELFARHRIFIPMPRVRSIDAMQVVISGVVNTRRFERRESEMLVIDDLFDLTVQRVDQSASAVIFDVAMRPVRSHDWELSEVALREVGSRRTLGRRGHVVIVDWSTITMFSGDRGHRTERLLAQMEDMRAADIARELHDMTPERRAEVASALDDHKLADALEELPEDEQVQLISELDMERAADVLEEMDPDDAADLIAELAPELAERLLGRMEPEDARDVRRLLNYAEFTAGGMMTPEPVILPPDATVADALARIRDADLTRRWPAWSTSAGRRWRPRPGGSWARCTSNDCSANRRPPWSRRWSTTSSRSSPTTPTCMRSAGTSPRTTWSTPRWWTPSSG
jgi:flagellar motility protein MotE (MotC chaperone)/sporulation protein YlmC with PRC-barrel domain